MQMVAYEQVQPSDTDLTPVLAKIRSAGAEMVLNPMTGHRLLWLPEISSRSITGRAHRDGAECQRGIH